MQDETWASRGVEIDNYQWKDLIDVLKEIAHDRPGPYERFLLAALPGLLARGLSASEAYDKAHEIAQLMTADD